MNTTINEKMTFPITLTPTAVKQFKFLAAKKGDPNLYLRLGVKGGGCSGLSYVMKFEPSSLAGDLEYNFDGLNVIVDPKSAKFLDGVTLDYTIANLLDGGWKWTNPNAGQSCGCGTSFTPKK